LFILNLKNKFYSLLKKVTDQAAELTQLSSELSDALTYISLCEERIGQLDPYATFPITGDEIYDDYNARDLNIMKGKDKRQCQVHIEKTKLSSPPSPPPPPPPLPPPSFSSSSIPPSPSSSSPIHIYLFIRSLYSYI